MKKKIFTILVLAFILSPVFAEEPLSNEPVSATTTQEIPFKEPVSTHHLIMKFLYAMGGVTASSLILFIGLSLYNKIRNGAIKRTDSDYSNTLNTPNNMKDAINIYLEKTRD